MWVAIYFIYIYPNIRKLGKGIQIFEPLTIGLETTRLKDTRSHGWWRLVPWNNAETPIVR